MDEELKRIEELIYDLWCVGEDSSDINGLYDFVEEELITYVENYGIHFDDKTRKVVSKLKQQLKNLKIEINVYENRRNIMCQNRQNC